MVVEKIFKVRKDMREMNMRDLTVGDKIEFELKNGKKAETVVVGRDHYEQGDIMLWFNRIVDKRAMNDELTNKGGWAQCDLREWLNGEFLEMLPNDLREIMVPKKNIQIIKGKPVESEDLVSLMSEKEVTGENYWSKENGTDKQFPFFENERDRIAIDDENETWWYWLADPSAANATAFCGIANHGYSCYTGASYAGGVAPLIVLRRAEQ